MLVASLILEHFSSIIIPAGGTSMLQLLGVSAGKNILSELKKVQDMIIATAMTAMSLNKGVYGASNKDSYILLR
jgi:hypothetical protein